ncbi:lipocalin family protein [Nocardia amikacinitolerans]|uniref:lipocalin family protein n=1 Tax=Nocardia amikacinitolerans TaxID=756689 RepID=UPI0020A483D6|nr:lipocalin family protein [Nocardia amikacinitolerans]MCP2291360.1 apolipoprotein D and lipocalin family protein [Nocardia amikacinitolerans]
MDSRRTTRWCARLATAVVAVAGAAAGTATAEPPAPVPSLELDRYLGQWRQLAAIPQFFNLACARDTTADYALDARGDIAVHNRCITWTGTVNEIRGTARVNDRATNAQLHVSFPGVLTQDQLDGPTNYIVTALGPDYSWALVTDPNRTSGFVLAREPALDPQSWSDVRAAIAAAGQDSCFYLTSPTTGGLSSIEPLCTA